MKHIDNKVGVIDSENCVSFQPLGLVHLLYRQDMYDKKTDEEQKTPDFVHLQLQKMLHQRNSLKQRMPLNWRERETHGSNGTQKLSSWTSAV